MSSLAVSALMQIALIAAVADTSIQNSSVATPVAKTAATYADAYKTTQDEGKPLVVLVGASWCPACQSMKTSTMPEVASRGGLQNVAFAYVNTDAQSDLANKLLEGNSIPQLVMYEKQGDSWKLKRLIGAQSPEAVQEFLGPAAKQPVAAKQPDGKEPVTAQPSTAAKQPTTAQRSASSQKPTAG